MSTSSTRSGKQPQVIVIDGESPSAEVRQWPLRDEPWAVAVLICVVTALSIGIGMIATSLWWGLGAAVALVVSLWRMWIPVEFRIGELGVIQTTLRRSWRIPWESFSDYEVRQSGVLLLPEDDNSVLGRMKGVYVPWGERKEDVLAVIAHYLDEAS